MPIPSKQCIATALVHMQAKRKWKPLSGDVLRGYHPESAGAANIDYFTPIYYNVLKSNGQMMWKPYELYILRASKITPAKLNDLLFKP